jgi:hypothetical protein
MAYKYVLNNPVTIGDLDSRMTVSAVRIAAISFNAESAKRAAGSAILSVVLEDVTSGHRVATLTYEDATALTMVDQLIALPVSGKTLEQVILQKLASTADRDGRKLPAGTISPITG